MARPGVNLSRLVVAYMLPPASRIGSLLPRRRQVWIKFCRWRDSRYLIYVMLGKLPPIAQAGTK
jgi:hypothetical protein